MQKYSMKYIKIKNNVFFLLQNFYLNHKKKPSVKIASLKLEI